MSKFIINLHEVVYSLSDALDLVGVTHIHHGKRVAYMAVECAKVMGWQKKQIDSLYQASILHDCGVSKTIIHKRLAQLEWEQEGDHCKIGASLLKSCPLLEYLSPIVLHHHTHWSTLKNMDLPDEVKLSANCIYLVDRVDVLSLGFMVDQSNLLLAREEIRQKIAERSGDWFCPELVDAFMRVSRSEAFWLSLENEHVTEYVSAWLSDTPEREMDFEELRSIVSIFSYIVDAKSSFTKDHSDGVARLARYLGEQFHLSELSCDMLELAGLLHDIGKLRQPDELLDKPGKLTSEEYSSIQRHSFDTYVILKSIKGLEKITQWAAQHHERADGSGYPYHLQNGSLSLEARIVAVADVFQALAQKRPYRDSLQTSQIIHIINEMVVDGKLDREVVMCVDKNLSECWNIAMGV
ncbi:3'3'-cGAMP-specific phosphodiesterase 1 [Ferriphaselus amnicola]|uniref:3'3'-cGAMP-specific phosphodiesterase 1 n=1 Tax=Ferriphaselus amnicola TaxID=1188319 RepID=A0A2Z6GBX4_9PROT|nr:HD domain-containing phosphohydrolase [Ferriphaselus amnicola]BBE50976.1 3'3'-cGAMP-specific phosphodiesterase 1 [Ferriphaselus amnicola]